MAYDDNVPSDLTPVGEYTLMLTDVRMDDTKKNPYVLTKWVILSDDKTVGGREVVNFMTFNDNTIGFNRGTFGNLGIWESIKPANSHIDACVKTFDVLTPMIDKFKVDATITHNTYRGTKQDQINFNGVHVTTGTAGTAGVPNHAPTIDNNDEMPNFN